jgi:UV excision repair protein RAD23
MKLIHSGKVLRDEQKLEECNLKPTDFLVCMITKAKKTAAVPVSTAAAVADVAPPDAINAKSTTAVAATAPSAAAAPASATSTVTTVTTAPPPPTTRSQPEFPLEVVASLTSMGFPEAEARACLAASNGNPDLAVEFLMNGIPPHLDAGATQPLTASQSSSSPTQPLQALRDHPQFDDLRRLVQHNPAMLQDVLAQIGRQQPDLLAQINENPTLFLEMMNEPIAASDPVASATTPVTSSQAGVQSTGAPGGGGMLSSELVDPTQMAQVLSNLTPDELNNMATMMGLTPDHLQATLQMFGQMQPEQLQEYMDRSSQVGGTGNNEFYGGGNGVGTPAPSLRLTEEEMASIDRLVDMGFERGEAIQAYVACDKNEALAANLLMDGGFAFDDDVMGGGEENQDDDMYD